MDMQALTLFNAMSVAGKTIYEVAQGISKLETKQQLMDVYDSLMNLKSRAADLEDENRKLKERLRFRGENFEFQNPFWFDKAFPERPLCPKCFTNEKLAPVSQSWLGANGNTYSKCLSCDTLIEQKKGHSSSSRSLPSRRSPWS